MAKNEQLAFLDPSQIEPEESVDTGTGHLPEPDISTNIRPLVGSDYDPNLVGFSEVQEDIVGGARDARLGDLRHAIPEEDNHEQTPHIGSYNKFKHKPVMNDRDLEEYIQDIRLDADARIRRAGRSVGQIMSAEEHIAQSRDALHPREAAHRRVDEIREQLKTANNRPVQEPNQEQKNN